MMNGMLLFIIRQWWYFLAFSVGTFMHSMRDPQVRVEIIYTQMINPCLACPHWTVLQINLLALDNHGRVWFGHKKLMSLLQGYGWGGIWVGLCILADSVWGGQVMGWAGDIRGWQVGIPYSVSGGCLVVVLSIPFVWSLGNRRFTFFFLPKWMYEWRHLWWVRILYLSGCDSNTGDIRQDRLGGLFFRWNQSLLPTPIPGTQLGFRNLDFLFFLFVGLGWVLGWARCIINGLWKRSFAIFCSGGIMVIRGRDIIPTLMPLGLGMLAGIKEGANSWLHRKRFVWSLGYMDILEVWPKGSLVSFGWVYLTNTQPWDHAMLPKSEFSSRKMKQAHKLLVWGWFICMMMGSKYCIYRVPDYWVHHIGSCIQVAFIRDHYNQWLLPRLTDVTWFRAYRSLGLRGWGIDVTKLGVRACCSRVCMSCHASKVWYRVHYLGRILLLGQALAVVCWIRVLVLGIKGPLKNLACYDMVSQGINLWFKALEKGWNVMKHTQMTGPIGRVQGYINMIHWACVTMLGLWRDTKLKTWCMGVKVKAAIMKNRAFFSDMGLWAGYGSLGLLGCHIGTYLLGWCWQLWTENIQELNYNCRKPRTIFGPAENYSKQGQVGLSDHQQDHEILGWALLKLKYQLGDYDFNWYSPHILVVSLCIIRYIDFACNGSVFPCRSRFLFIPSLGSTVSYFWSPRYVLGDLTGGMPPLMM
ncbi:hypothetical protein Hanom_Chr15g01337321 [Helianthus anomalus]